MLPFELRIVLVFLVALLSTLYILPRLARIAQRIGLVDIPRGRKKHAGPRPLVGGIAFVIAATFTSMAFISIQGFRGYFLGLSILLFFGFLDDFRELNPYQKFAAQILACALLTYFSQLTLRDFGSLLGGWSLRLPDTPWLIWPVTIFCLVGVINAVNMMDGMDGLAGSIAFIAFIAFSCHAFLDSQYAMMLLNLALAGAVLGFLRYNWSPASLFMGDAGSLCLGYSLGFVAIALTQKPDVGVHPVAPLLILAVPIVDTVSVMARRIKRGVSPFSADNYHLHHLLYRHGFSREKSVNIILAITTLLATASFLQPIYGLSDSTMFAIFTAYFLVYFLSSHYMLRQMEREEHLTGEVLLAEPAARSMSDWSFFTKRRKVRRSIRYNVNLRLQCVRIDGAEETWDGEVVNISNDGFLARLDGFHEQGIHVVARIFFTFEHCTHIIEMPSKHVWNDGDGHYHGFQFMEFDGQQERIVFKFLISEKSQGGW
ncbi:MAG: PilZ domain-containing protein [Desulfobulbaceae bacterium]|jgi:UDP-GlcNAc:undecaprenyl-phosphate GlcNAc-1-phosphate transferase|nr:PilZ domain-containing protein [Desulfobulbaceae bacterium]